MAIKDLISPGVGFEPGGVAFIVTRGLSIGAAAAPAIPDAGWIAARGRAQWESERTPAEWSAPDRRAHWEATR